MTKRRMQLFLIGLLLLSALGTVGFARFTSAQELIKSNNVARDVALEEIANYRQWTKVNEKPLLVLNASDLGG